MRLRAAGVCGAAMMLLAAVAACGNSEGATGNCDTTTFQPARDALAAIEGQVLSKGPNDEDPVDADAVTLTEDEVAKVRDGRATAAIAMHYTGDDWTAAQIRGLRAEFDRLGIEVIGVTDAGADPGKQVSDLETISAKKPDILVSIPTDGVATADAYRAIANQGTKLVFMDEAPKGFQSGKDYLSVVSADNYGNGVVSAHLLADALGGRGTIGAVFYDTDFFVTNKRFQGFKDVLARDYPEIRIVEQKGFVGPDYAGDVQNAANAMLTKHPDLDAIWGVWDVPTEGILAAARGVERSDLIVATEDLGENVAIDMAKNRLVKGLGAQRPYDQGVTEARIAGYGLLGKQPPPYVALPPMAVTHDNLLEAWEEVYHEEAPDSVKQSFRACEPAAR